jgi:hypothetical protein
MHNGYFIHAMPELTLEELFGQLEVNAKETISDIDM